MCVINTSKFMTTSNKNKIYTASYLRFLFVKNPQKPIIKYLHKKNCIIFRPNGLHDLLVSA